MMFAPRIVVITVAIICNTFLMVFQFAFIIYFLFALMFYIIVNPYPSCHLDRFLFCHLD